MSPQWRLRGSRFARGGRVGRVRPVPPRRLSPVTDTVQIRVDKRAVPAVAGEPLAVALAASGRLVLGRSIKYHRPRGAACYSGRCDGCLMRVDGVANVTTCHEPVREGMVVETQNVLGSAKTDLLSATDWFFPDGMNHHEMFTALKPMNEVMQKIARRISGIGRLPDRTLAPVAVRDLACDVLVVGAGPAGLMAASACAERGLDVVVCDDEPRAGGHLVIFPGDVRDEGMALVQASALAERLVRRAREAGVRILLSTTVAAAYDDVVVVAERDGLARARPARIVAATGLHEGAAAYEGADRPGVVGARAASVLLSYGVLPGERVALVGEGPWTRALAERLSGAGAHVVGPIAPGAVLGFRGSHEVEAVEVVHDNTRAQIECDAAAIETDPSAAYELASQAGAGVVWRNARFSVDASPDDGRTVTERVRAVGECTGMSSLAAIAAQARGAATAIAKELGRG